MNLLRTHVCKSIIYLQDKTKSCRKFSNLDKKAFCVDERINLEVKLRIIHFQYHPYFKLKDLTEVIFTMLHALKKRLSARKNIPNRETRKNVK